MSHVKRESLNAGISRHEFFLVRRGPIGLPTERFLPRLLTFYFGPGFGSRLYFFRLRSIFLNTIFSRKFYTVIF